MPFRSPGRWGVRHAGVILLGAACASPSALPLVTPARLSDPLSFGDERTEASQRLLLEGLAAESAGQRAAAAGRYDRALQVDPANPWAFLALARFAVAAGDGVQALAHLEQARALFESVDAFAPGVEVHLVGLRGVALALSGRRHEAQAWLERAAASSPGVWGDARLDPDELR